MISNKYRTYSIEYYITNIHTEQETFCIRYIQEANYICMPFNHQELCFIVGKLRFLYLHKKVIYHFIFLLSSSSIRQKEILKEKKNYVLHRSVMLEDEKASHYYYIWCRIYLSLDRMSFAFSNELFTDRSITFYILSMNNNKPYSFMA